MAPGPAAIIPLFAATWFFVSAAYLRYKQRQLPDLIGEMTPVAVYLTAIGLFFLFRGWSAIATTSCPVVDCTDLSGGVAVVIAASFIALYPLRELLPGAYRWVFFVLMWVSVISQAVAAVVAPSIQVPLAHVYASLVAGVFAVGYLVYDGITTDSATETGIGMSMGSCCVVAHGLAALPLVATVTLPLVGIPLGLPVLFAVLAPVSLIAVLVFVARVEAQAAIDPGVEADASS